MEAHRPPRVSLSSLERKSADNNLYGKELKRKTKRKFDKVKLINKLFSKKKTSSIEFCQRNLDEFLKEDNLTEFNQFLSQKNIIYKEYECQSKCKECRLSPYAVVDGKLIAAENSDELLIKLKEEVKK